MFYSKRSRKFETNKINPKCYWSILRSFLNNKTFSVYLPLIHSNQFAVDFKEKSQLINSFFNVLIFRPEAIYLPRHCVEQMNP